MSSQSTEMEDTSLGELLRETRNKQGLDLIAIAEETKISLKNLQAIEDGDFVALPAEAFTRGFYSLYAKTLSLDPADVLKRYALERPNQNKSGNRSTLSGKMALDVNNMAERPTLMPFSTFGLVLLLLLLFGAFLCWYFSWNPATYLSQKLRSLQEEPTRIEQVLNSQTAPGVLTPFAEIAVLKRGKPAGSALFNLPSAATASMAQQERSERFVQHTAVVSDLYVKPFLKDRTEFTWPIADQPQTTLSFKIGESATWKAGKKLLITFPAKSHCGSNNKLPLDLSYGDKTFVTLSIPYYSRQY